MLLLLSLYVFYIFFVISIDRGPVDYETFMSIGQKFVGHEAIYTTNSYYPLPYAAIFGVFSLLPRPISLFLWLLLPVIAALFITKFSPFTLLFAPLFGHFVGGQSAIFGLIGFWGYREHADPENIAGGVWLSLTTLKPQLGIAPILWASVAWMKYIRATRRIPKQAISFVISVLAIYAPAFFFFPNWMGEWLQNPRPLFLRALSGIVPRILVTLAPENSVFFWAVLCLSCGLLFFIIWKITRQQISLDVFTLFSFLISPLMHDYDLIQLIPMIKSTREKAAAVLLSLPGWVVIFTQYTNDMAWFVFTLIAPGLLILKLHQIHKYNKDLEPNNPVLASRISS
jgi:hypothetical protein